MLAKLLGPVRVVARWTGAIVITIIAAVAILVSAALLLIFFGACRLVEWGVE